MDLSDTAIVVGVILVLISIVSAIVYIVVARRRLTQGKSGKEEDYVWKPEQDHDVVWSQESLMSPPWPTLKKREKQKRQ